MASSLFACQRLTNGLLLSCSTCSTTTFRQLSLPSVRNVLSSGQSKFSIKTPFLMHRQCRFYYGIKYRTCLRPGLFSFVRSHRLLLHTVFKSIKASQCKIKTLALLPGLSFLEKFRHHDHVLSPEILANIPKEVLRKDIPKKKKRKSTLLRVIASLWESLRLVLRFVRILITFTPLIAIYPIVSLSEKLKYLYWRLLVYTLEGFGTTFIKLGQWAGTRRDLFSAEFCDVFSCLHVHTMVHSWRVSKKKLRKAFGKRWREILVRVHKKPIGSGCIAQVHKAYMPADMIPDEALVDEIMEDTDDTDEPEIDFADGLEIVGLGNRDDDHDDLEDEDYSVTRRRAPVSVGGPQQEINTEVLDNNSHYSPDATDASTEDDDISEAYVDPDQTQGGDMEEGEEFDEPQLVPVAVKILHPGVYHGVQRDLRILSSLVWLVEKIFPSLRWLSLQECMAEFKELLTRQIDLRMEAECLEEFNQNFAEHPNILFPKPVWPYCKKSVLIETYEEGEPITNFLMEQSEQENETLDGLKEKLASFGIDALLQMIFVDNFVHGDLHPGNILVQNIKDYIPQEDSKLMMLDLGDTVIVNVKPIDCPVKLVMLDVGITASLSEEDRENFRRVFTAVVVGDGLEVAELMLRHARYNKCNDVETFKKELGDIVVQARKNTISLGQVQVGQLLSKVFSVLSKHKVKMESNFASILLAIFVLEGLGRSLDPEIDILEKAKPILLG